MPSGKKNRKNKKIVTKKKTATVPTRPRKKPIKATSGTKSLKRSARKAQTSKKRSALRKRSQIDALSDIERETRNQRLTSAGGTGLSDFQGLSRAEEADSESVAELVEEGNVLESGAVAGVEEADNQDEREVHPRELPEDDVPDEYLDKD